jgi:hypothetical protein
VKTRSSAAGMEAKKTVSSIFSKFFYILQGFNVLDHIGVQTRSMTRASQLDSKMANRVKTGNIFLLFDINFLVEQPVTDLHVQVSKKKTSTTKPRKPKGAISINFI